MSRQRSVTSQQNISERVNAVICNPPFNPCQIAVLSSLEQTFLSLRNISQLVEVLSVMMNLRSCKHQFCSSLQLETWEELTIGMVENFMTEINVVRVKEGWSKKPTIVEVEVKV